MSALAILCPGQGDQHPAMLDLALSSEAGRAVVAEAASALGEEPLSLARRGAPDLYRNAIAQPLVCAAELATWAALRNSLPRPALFAGYSLGELAAYGCAGALAPAAAVGLAVTRAGLMEAASPSPGGLVALRGLALSRAEALAAEVGAAVAIVNGLDHCVLGGTAEALAAVERRAPLLGASAVRRLPVGVPAHTALLADAVAPFAEALRRAGLSDPGVPVLAGVSGEAVRRAGEGIETLARQLAARIEWARCLAVASEMGCAVFLELGPGDALSRMVREAVPGAKARSVAEFRSLTGVAGWVEGNLAGP